MDINDGDTLIMEFRTPAPQILNVAMENGIKPFLIQADKLYILTPAARRKLARGVLVNWIDDHLFARFRRRPAGKSYITRR
jgi:hypothetical protein